MTLTDRDRRILTFLAPLAILAAYWFLLLSPKRDELKTARDAQAQAETARNAAVAQAAQLEKARQNFAADYAAVVRLGKAIPERIDEPSLLVQLDRAANGTHINFDSISFGARATTKAPTSTTTSTSGPAQPAGNAAAGGAPASTGLGRNAERAGNAVNSANSSSSAAGGTSTTTTTTTTSTGTTTSGAASTTAPATLDTVALTFNFSGSYFDLADFFHRIKRLVYVSNSQIFVRGRLLTIDSLTFSPNSSTPGTTGISATVGASVYLSPKATGVAGGTTSAGPTGTALAPLGTQVSSVPLATAGGR